MKRPKPESPQLFSGLRRTPHLLPPPVPNHQHPIKLLGLLGILLISTITQSTVVNLTVQ
ncbi:MAG TPA: hypothetical protein VH117_11035 [Edaphobacter sp.]|nr:hypothetical protein [Edaphobacter sp.]